MERTTIGYLLLLISGVLAACASVPTVVRTEESSPHTAHANKPQGDGEATDKILFKGNNMTVIESERVVLKQVRSNDGKKSCLNKAEENIKKKSPALSFNGNTKYFEIEAEQTYNFGPDKFTVNLDRDLFSKIDRNSLNKLDEYVGFTITRDLYFIKNDGVSYLLLIGQPSAGSGLGLYYMAHLLMPLASDRPDIEFQSISDDPRRIKIADSSATYYEQIDLDNNAVKDQTSKRVSLMVSSFTVDSSGDKRLESKFALECENLDSILNLPGTSRQ